MKSLCRRMAGGWLVLATVLAGCGRRTEPAHGTDTTSATQMTMPSVTMLPGFEAHLDSMATAAPSARQLEMHESVANRLLAAMASDMRAMSVGADTSWQGLSDSVYVDLSELPQLAGQALDVRWLAHIDRMRRLAARHAAMMH